MLQKKMLFISLIFFTTHFKKMAKRSKRSKKINRSVCEECGDLIHDKIQEKGIPFCANCL